MIDHVIGHLDKILRHEVFDILLGVEFVKGGEHAIQPVIAHREINLPIEVSHSKSWVAPLFGISLRTSKYLK